MLRKKIFCALVLFFVVVNIVVAQNEDDKYKDHNYYINSNPKDWDYTKVDWSLVPTSKIKDIPPNKLSYFQLNSEQRRAMISEQIAVNFDNIDDLTKDVGGTEAEEAISRKYGVSVDLGNGANLKNGILSATYGHKDRITITDSIYKNGLIRIIREGSSEEGTIYFKPNTNKKMLVIPPTDSVTIEYLPDHEKTYGKLKLPSGAEFIGLLSYRNGQAYVKYGDFVVVNDVRVESSATGKLKKDILIFFDGNEHSEVSSHYVSLNPQTKRSFTHSDIGESIKLRFMRGNPFLRIEGNPFGKGDDAVSFDIDDYIEVSIQNRDNEGLIPLVDIRFTEDLSKVSNFMIDSGSVGVEGYVSTNEVGGTVFELRTPTDFFEEYSSSPMTILIHDKSGNNLVGTPKEPKKILISNYNELATIPLEAEEGFATEKYGYAPAKFSERLYFNYEQFNVENLRKKYPNLEINGRLDSQTIKRLSDTLERFPNELTEKVKVINFLTDDEMKAGGEPETTKAVVDKNGDLFIRGTRLEDRDIYHELTHVYFKNFEDVSGAMVFQDEYFKKWDVIDAIKDKNPDDSRLSKLYDEVEALRVKFEEKREHPMKKEWKEVAGDVYLHTIEKYKGGHVWKEVSNKESYEAFGPRYGLVRSYGATSIGEDIATFVEDIYVAPDFYKPLITKDERYLQKLNLLLKYKFITPEAYKRIMQ